MRSSPCLLILLVFVQSITLTARAQSRDTLVLHFDFDRYTLRSEDATRLERFFHQPEIVIDTLLITGYTDTIGTNVYNQGLSLRRARSVAAYIRQQGSLSAITVRGLGEVVAGSDSLNRRVEIVLGHRPMPNATAAVAEPATPTSSAPAPIPYAPQPDTIITLANINFIEDSPNLTEASRMIIPEYVSMLQRYKGDSLEIDGYCHSQTPITSTSDPLFKLSVKRAQLIYDYLIDEGFDRTKLSYKGMGNATPKNEHPLTAEEARANMRVEIRVFHKYSTTL